MVDGEDVVMVAEIEEVGIEVVIEVVTRVNTEAEEEEIFIEVEDLSLLKTRSTEIRKPLAHSHLKTLSTTMKIQTIEVGQEEDETEEIEVEEVVKLSTPNGPK